MDDQRDKLAAKQQSVDDRKHYQLSCPLLWTLSVTLRRHCDIATCRAWRNFLRPELRIKKYTIIFADTWKVEGSLHAKNQLDPSRRFDIIPAPGL